MSRWNIAEFCESQLLERFGFEADRIEGSFVRRIDAQHAVMMEINGFGRGPNAGTNPSYEVWLARRDINELRIELATGSRKLRPWSGTLREPPASPFLGRPVPGWQSITMTEEMVAGYLEKWIPPLDGLANLGFMEKQMTTTSPITGEQSYRIVRIPNRMLSGWRDEDELLIEQELASVQQYGPEVVVRVEMEAKIERVRAWIAEHPDGVERELAGE